MVTAYETRLDRDLKWALKEGSMHFEKESAVHRALERITARLDQLGVAYAVVGGMALFFHGFRRFTEDIDILVSREGLDRIHRELEGLGWVPPFEGSKNLRDAELGVKIEFLVTGEYPGDGKPKPVAFPDPAAVGVEVGGVRCVNLPTLVELKLTSGMTAPGRLKDLGDIEQVIRTLDLPRDFALRLNPFVRSRYEELWDGVEAGRRLE